MTAPVLLWQAASGISKTGRVPTAWVRRDARAESCAGCAHFRKDKPSKSACYAWSGTVSLGASSIDRAASKRPERYTLEDALRRREWSARIARLTALGDPTAAPREELSDALVRIRAAGLRVVGYTHRWHHPDNGWLRESLLASCSNAKAVSRARALGWRVARTVSAETFARVMARPTDANGVHVMAHPDGARLGLCPATVAQLQADTGPHPTCNDCQMCAVDEMERLDLDGVVFPLHGPAQEGTPWRNMVAAARDAAKRRKR